VAKIKVAKMLQNVGKNVASVGKNKLEPFYMGKKNMEHFSWEKL
jgi:hypothetical protein